MHGVLSITKSDILEAKHVAFVGFIEGYLLIGPQGRLKELDDNFQHILSEENEIGFLLASHDNLSCFISHNDCSGKLCFCQKLAERFICPEEDHPEADKMSHLIDFLLSQSFHTPLLAILVDFNGATKIITHYSSDLAVEEMPSGCYRIRNCFISECDPESIKTMQEFTTNNPLLGEVLETASLKATIAARDHIEYWPKPIGLGITLWKDASQTVITVTNPIGDQHQELTSRVAKPKKPVTAYNYFSRIAHEQVKNNHPHPIGKNELNKIMGQKWQSMSRLEQLPYLDYAEADKKRYEQEMKAYHAQTGKTNPSTRPGVNAYNLFVQQEKQYINGMKQKDKNRSGVGKHCGDRWQSMSKGEKDLYHALKDASESMAAPSNEKMIAAAENNDNTEQV